MDADDVAKLLVRNLPERISTDELYQVCVHCIRLNGIINVQKMDNTAVITFTDRSSAEHAIYFLQGVAINDEDLIVSWSRPTTHRG